MNKSNMSQSNTILRMHDLRSRLIKAAHDLGAEPTTVPSNQQQLKDLFAPDQQFAPAAVLVPICWRTNGATIVLTKRNDDLKHHAGQISFPGGKVESSDRDAIAAALRESQEEIGLDPENVEPIGFLDPLLTITGFRVVPVIAIINPAAQFLADPSEVAEIFEVPLEFVLNPNNRVERELLFRGQVRRVQSYPYAHYDIWGATAAILDNLSARMAQFANEEIV